MNRKQFQTAYSGGRARQGEPSLEEMGAGASIALAHELALDLQSLDQDMAKLDTLVQLQQVVRHIPSQSNESLALIEVALAAVGEPTVVPSLESYHGQALSTEGLGSRIRQLIENIRSLIRGIVAKFKSFFGALKDDSGQLQFRLDLARDVHKELAGRFPKKAQVALGQTALMLAMREGVPHDARLLLTYGDNIENQLSILRKDYVPVITGVGNNLIRVLQDPSLRAGSADVWLAKMIKATETISFSRLKPMISPLQRMVDNRFTVESAWMAPPILGGRALVLLDGNRDHSGDDLISRAMAARHTKYVFVRPYQAKQVDTSTAYMATLPHNMIGALMDLVQRLINEVGASETEGLRRSLNDMDRQLGALVAAVPEQLNDVEMIQVGLGFGTSFSQWCTAPYLQLISHTLSVCNALIGAINKHMAAYR